MKNIPDGMYCNGCPCMDVNMNNRKCRIFGEYLQKDGQNVWKGMQCSNNNPKITMKRGEMIRDPLWDELKMEKIRKEVKSNG